MQDISKFANEFIQKANEDKNLSNVYTQFQANVPQYTLNIDYDKVPNLASEARIKLKEVRPLSFSQASRISGVNPSDIAILSVYMKRYFDEYK